MDNGKGIITKLPNPNAGRPHYTTASEVATMDFPCIGLKYSQYTGTRSLRLDSSSKSPVGTEYIFMERSPGVELDNVWENMSGPARLKIVEAPTEYEASFVTCSLSMYGSLCYVNDVHEVLPSQMVHLPSSTSVRREPHRQFAVGPTTNRTYFDDGCGEVDSDLGPYQTFDDNIRS
ncbi:hypothetical protein M501DRAFT_989087 [Patellaria atrata CBS 101060]|uniref:Uncharacterized protein n=1 Tax=Patellaria atrata CBS 101060 TaxID=1346257 RepID=A0A9P4S4Q1_9PEZI|nr:hypothetical protein M501DRAFT_989087 [Patellaria atrata CBS 101060]